MGMKLLLPLMIVSAVVVALAGCATTPSGRSQVMLVDDKQMNALGIEAFSQLKSTGKVSTNAAQKRYVRCVSDALIAELPAQWRDLPWEVEVFQDESANAFALPGGKVGVNTGMFNVAQNADQLAAVVGHELAHVMYRHGAERMSQQLLAQAGMTAATLAANASSPENSQLIVGALGAGAQVGVLLPFSRHHEGEADRGSAPDGARRFQASRIGHVVGAHAATVRWQPDAHLAVDPSQSRWADRRPPKRARIGRTDP
jgi:predicted Zn-dependent protease